MFFIVHVGAATDTTAVMETLNVLAVKPKQTGISGDVRTRPLSVVLYF